MHSSSHSVMLDGGTAWGCQIFVARQATSVPETGKRIPLYVFDQITEAWYQCYVDKTSLTWESIHSPPPPTGSYAGIGSRDLTPAGRQAIRHVYTI